jgi:hypothetical protein
MGKRALTGRELTCLDFKFYMILLETFKLQLFFPRKCTKVSINIANNTEFVHYKRKTHKFTVCQNFTKACFTRRI